MSAIPGGLDTEQGPPMTVPLRHFLVGLGFLLAGVTLPLVVPASGYGPQLAHIHLLLVGWVCVTIMGAMTQFVPVWSGAPLHSRPLAQTQLALVSIGVTGLATAFLTGALWLAAPAGALTLAGFWTFCYNLARTLAWARPLDTTEAHFAMALAAFLLVTAFGLLLAADFTWSLFPLAGVARFQVVEAHATLAVFGSVGLTVAGALYQLGTMFTNTDLSPWDRRLQRVESALLPGGVGALAAGRLLRDPLVARAGAVALLAGLAALAFVVGHRLLDARVSWTPMLRRYAVVVLATLAWVGWTLPAWLADPLSPTSTLGPPGAAHLLALGVLAFVVLGTLYHIVPFLVWVRRYSDRVGLEPVPMVDDLYDDRVARADLVALTVGSLLVVLGESGVSPMSLTPTGGVLVALGVLGAVLNLLLVLRRHAAQSLVGVLGLSRKRAAEDAPEDSAD